MGENNHLVIEHVQNHYHNIGVHLQHVAALLLLLVGVLLGQWTNPATGGSFPGPVLGPTTMNSWGLSHIFSFPVGPRGDVVQLKTDFHL